jgi:predicted transcriptional regulator
VITPAHVRAARAALRLKQVDLAKAAGVSLQAVKNYEQELVDPRVSTLAAIEKALIDAGIEFEAEAGGKQRISWRAR